MSHFCVESWCVSVDDFVITVTIGGTDIVNDDTVGVGFAQSDIVYYTIWNIILRIYLENYFYACLCDLKRVLS